MKKTTTASKQVRRNQSSKLPLGIGMIIISIVLVGGFLFVSSQRKGAKQISMAIPTPTPTPRPIPHGKGAFAVSTEKTGPRMTLVTLNPYDPSKGETMEILINAYNTEAITSVTAQMQTDHKSSSIIPCSLIEGDAIKGTWKCMWNTDDTYLYTYNLTVIVTAPNGTHNNTITLR